MHFPCAQYIIMYIVLIPTTVSYILSYDMQAFILFFVPVKNRVIKIAIIIASQLCEDVDNYTTSESTIPL